MNVRPARLAMRRVYPGFQYQAGAGVDRRPARRLELSGRDWRDLIHREQLRLEVVAGDPGCLAAFAGSALAYEVYEDEGLAGGPWLR